LAARLALDLCPSSFKIRDGHPTIDPNQQVIFQTGPSDEGNFVKFPLADRLEVYRSDRGDIVNLD